MREGDSFGRWTVVGHSAKLGYVSCRCACGTVKDVYTSSLVRGKSQSCGCLRSEINRDARRRNISGFRFGKLIALRPSGEYSGTEVIWRCKCDCGNESSVIISNLTTGHTKSCGCSKREATIKRNTKHGMYGTKEYAKAQTKIRAERKRGLDVLWTANMEVALQNLFPACVICGSSEYLATDHLLPLSKGYGLSPSNAVRLCKSCNSRKKNKMLNQMPALDQDKLMEASRKFIEYWQSLQERQ